MLFLMDTHGLFDSDWSLDYNRVIATFTTLISSLQIFNIKEQIAGDVLDTLEVCIREWPLVNDHKIYQTTNTFK